MYLSKDRCSKCLNLDNCEYRGKYVCSTYRLRELLASNTEVEWYGTLSATCDYFVKNPETDVTESCG